MFRKTIRKLNLLLNRWFHIPIKDEINITDNLLVEIFRDGKCIKKYRKHNSMTADAKTAIRDALKDGTSPKIDHIYVGGDQTGWIDAGTTTNTAIGDPTAQFYKDWTCTATDFYFIYALAHDAIATGKKFFQQIVSDDVHVGDHIVFTWQITANG